MVTCIYCGDCKEVGWGFLLFNFLCQSHAYNNIQMHVPYDISAPNHIYVE